MPAGKFAPCCRWKDHYFDSQQEMVDKVGGAFLAGQVPKGCEDECPSNSDIGWRNQFKNYDTDYKNNVIHFLDFRNNNVCNLKCRSCGPGFSTSWAAESKQLVRHEDSIRLDEIDLSQCKMVYFAGGEPLLNPQHYDILKMLIAQNIKPKLLYSSNMSVTGYKDQQVADLWKHFDNIQLHASIDAVGKYAEIVRSGTNWATIEDNLTWARQLPNVKFKVGPVISAINIWWIKDLFDYFDWMDLNDFEPVLAWVNDVNGIRCIPSQYRPELIAVLEQSKFKSKYTIQRALEVLREPVPTTHWYQFLAQQLILDNYRNENWYDNLPIKHNIYTESFKL
jgi:hypothetical protein